MNITPCFISEMPGEKTKALLIGFYQKAWTHMRIGNLFALADAMRMDPRDLVEKVDGR